MKKILIICITLIISTTIKAQIAKNDNEVKASKEISAAFPYESNYIDIKDSKMYYIEEGQGDPILFLHGNPTSSYLWRNIIPYLSKQGRCIAPDLIGMGQSGKPEMEYGFENTYEYLEEFIEKMELKNVTLVLHDWGSGLGFHYANTHRENIKSIAFMEAMYDAPTLYDMPFSIRTSIKMMRNPFFGKIMGIHMNMFIKKMLPDMVVRELTKEEQAFYAAPYQSKQSRIPIIAWPKDVPFADAKPNNITPYVESWAPWLASVEIPKLMFYVTPGVAIKEKDVKIIKETFVNTEIINLGHGLHFIQEDYPHEIGEALSKWYSEFVLDK